MCKVTSLYPSQLQNYKIYPSCGDTAPVLWTLPQLGGYLVEMVKKCLRLNLNIILRNKNHLLSYRS